MRWSTTTAALLGLTGLGLTVEPGVAQQIEVIERPEVEERSPFYASNRPPLKPGAFVKLPVGTVRPEGWLKRQLELQADGFHGHLTEISAFLRKENNSWLSAEGQGEYGWEEVPYWLKGFADCAYLLDREDQIAEAKTWIEAVLNSQQDDGFFGPRGQGAKSTVGSTEGKYDLWPNMVMLNVLQSYYEYTQDQRVLDLITRYFEWELKVPDDEFLLPYWQQQRAADNLASVYWLYNRTGAPWLLELATKIHDHTANWTDGVPNWHNVNIAQAFGGPATYWLQSGDEKHWKAPYGNYDEVRAKYGQVPGALWGGDENSRPGYDDPRQAVETCGMVEFMHSAERLVAITGDPVWADRCEDVAFNMLPAALTADLRALRYLTAPNQAISDRRNHNPGIQNSGPMFCMDPNDHRCCQHNFGQGWPYLAEHLWMASHDRGAALIFPIASTVRMKVGPGEGTEVAWTCETHYPFEPEISLRLKTPSEIEFPLYVRLPGWAQSARVFVNEEASYFTPIESGYLRIQRTWFNNDTVRVILPMEVRLRTWEKNHNAVSVDRGPLTYSLEIGEEYVPSGGTSTWPAFEIRPTTPWNYALVLPPAEPTDGFQVIERDWPQNDQPWAPQSVPVVLAARGKQVPEWQIDVHGLVAPMHDSPVKTDQPTREIRLIPMGAARLRISAFPVAGSGPDAHVWPKPPEPPAYQISVLHWFERDSVEAPKDLIEPTSSSDVEIPRLTWWPHKGTQEWLAYTFAGKRTVKGVQVYWFDDTSRGGGCALPASWTLEASDGETWRPVPGAIDLNPVADQFQAVSFKPIEATALRLVVQLQPDRSAGVLEWKVD